MESEGSSPYSQESATGPYPDTDKSSRNLPNLFLQDQF
jgi:hypothetical protein